MIIRNKAAFFAVLSGLWLGNAAVGDLITVVTNLEAGDEYRLVFVTSTPHQATSSVITTRLWTG